MREAYKGYQYNRDYYKVWKLGAFALYGSKCAVCGFDDERALQLDHVEAFCDNKAQERASYKIYRGLVDGTISVTDFQLLCANHNWIKRIENNENRSLSETTEKDAQLPRKITRVIDSTTFNELVERANKMYKKVDNE